MINYDSFKVTLPLKKAFAVSKGSTTTKTNLLTVMNNRYNGEASCSVHYGPSVEEVQQDIATGLALLSETDTIGVETLEAIRRFNIDPIAKSAIMGMVLNYLSGESKRYPWEILSLGTPVGIKSSFTISIEKPDQMIQTMTETDFPILKIKMGNEEDLMLLDVFDNLEGKDVRIDANGGWSCAKAEEMIFHLYKKGIRVIEQPTDAEFVKEWPHMKAKSMKDMTLVMDEGLNTAEDFEQYKEYIDGVNIKMEKCGGILEGLDIANRAREADKKVMLGCMVESSVGIAQSVYMSSRADFFDLDGPLLLETDIARGIHYEREQIEVDREIIGGPKLNREILEQYIQE
jgi:L-alanine-DL-glutamate epimerase-like enolase superfamily enzyme